MYQLYRDFNLVKKGPKNLGMCKPPPLFGQCPKENVFSLLMSSLTLHEFVFVFGWQLNYCLVNYCLVNCCLAVLFTVVSARKKCISWCLHLVGSIDISFVCYHVLLFGSAVDHSDGSVPIHCWTNG